MYRTNGHANPGKTTLQANTIGIFMPKGVFGISYWSSRRRFKGARDGPSSAALKRLNCPTVTPAATTTLVCLLRLSASIFLCRVIAALSSSFLHPAINLRPPLMTVSSHAPRSSAAAFQSPRMPKARASSATQSVHSFSFPHAPRCPGPSIPPNMTQLGSLPQFIRMNAPAHCNLLVRTVVSMLSYPIRWRASG